MEKCEKSEEKKKKKKKEKKEKKKTYVSGAQKNRLIETVLLSTHNICFGLEIRILFSLHNF